MNQIITMTLPAKPQEKEKIELMIAPLMMEIIGQKTKSLKMITLNTLHTYEDVKKNKNIYLKQLYDFSVNYDEFYEDSDHKKELLEIIENLIKMKKIKEKEKKIYICKCGKVEFVEEGKKYENGKMYTKTNMELICNECHSKLEKIQEKVLTLKYNSKFEKIKVLPSFLSKEINYFSLLFENSDIPISKLRNTAINIKVNNKIYNIDIEFLWSQLHGITRKNQIMIASNHQVYVMFILNYFNRIYMNKDILFILTPYMNNKTKFNDFDNKINQLSSIKLKLFLFYSLKWNKKTCSWDYGLYKKIKNLEDSIVKKMYISICSKINTDNMHNIICDLENDFLKRDFDKDLKKIKESILN